MDQDREDYADPGTGRPRRWVRGLVVLVGVVGLFGVGLGGARVFYAIRDHFAR